MESHRDQDARQAMSDEFMRRLKGRAEQISAVGASQITAGKPGEPTMAEWEHNGVHVKRLPADEQGILRISIGGGDKTPVSLNYCVFRGEPTECRALLAKAIAALDSEMSGDRGIPFNG